MQGKRAWARRSSVNRPARVGGPPEMTSRVAQAGDCDPPTSCHTHPPAMGDAVYRDAVVHVSHTPLGSVNRTQMHDTNMGSGCEWIDKPHFSERTPNGHFPAAPTPGIGEQSVNEANLVEIRSRSRIRWRIPFLSFRRRSAHPLTTPLLTSPRLTREGEPSPGEAGTRLPRGSTACGGRSFVPRGDRNEGGQE